MLAAWNCNGSLRLHVGAFEDSFKGRDIVFYLETHQAPGQLLPHVIATNGRQRVEQRLDLSAMDGDLEE